MHVRSRAARTEAALEAARLAEAEALTTGFVRRAHRYLWTDAFAVCNFVALERIARSGRHLAAARDLVDRVHHTLGRHRGDDGRSGWLSGLAGAEAEEHPTRAGLRIGKPLAERGEGEVADPELEWERDGQYFHYLTKWMVALDVLARETRDARYARWARELAIAAHDAFTYTLRSGMRRMYWKMSVDLRRPLVASMGQHDPLDGLVTYAQLAETARALAGDAEAEPLDAAARSFASILEGGADLATTDPLGLGGLLVDASRLDQLTRRGAFDGGGLFEELLDAALAGLSAFSRSGELTEPAERRLAFRELGLAIGLAAVERMPAPESPRARTLVRAIEPYLVLRIRIASFWLVPEHRRAASWIDHRDIDDVMLAASLLPDGCVTLRDVNAT